MAESDVVGEVRLVADDLLRGVELHQGLLVAALLIEQAA